MYYIYITRIIDGGIGETHLNTVLTSLDIPILTPTILKRNERIVGKAIETVPKKSCSTSIELEKTLPCWKETHVFIMLITHDITRVFIACALVPIQHI